MGCKMHIAATVPRRGEAPFVSHRNRNMERVGLVCLGHIDCKMHAVAFYHRSLFEYCIGCLVHILQKFAIWRACVTVNDLRPLHAEFITRQRRPFLCV